MGMFRWAAPLFGHFGDRWSEESIQRISGWLRPYLSGDCPQQCRILDVGGGTGALARRLHDSLGAQVVVLDPTPEMLRYLPEHRHVTGTLGAAEAIPFDDSSFDAVVVTDAFHHFRHQRDAVHEFARVVRCGGGVLILELDPRGWMRAIVTAEKLLGEPGAFFEPNALCAFMAENGIAGECERIKGPSYRYLGTVERRPGQ